MAEPLELPEPLKQIVDANVRYYQALGRVTADYVKAMGRVWTEALSTVPGLGGKTSGSASAATGATAGAARATAAQPALLLEAEAGESAQAAFMVNNALQRTVSAAVASSDFTAADGRTVQPVLRIQPGTVTLEPGGRTLVQVAALVDDSLVPGLSYRGELSVPGLSDTPIPVVLRRRPAAPASPGSDTSATAGGADGPGGATAAAASGSGAASGKAKVSAKATRRGGRGGAKG